MKHLSLFLICIASLASAQVKVYPPSSPTQQAPGIKATVLVKALSEVDGPRYTLGDIAEIVAAEELKAKLEQIDMGAAPVAGIPRPVVAARIQSFLMVAGLKAKEFDVRIAPDAKVALKVQTIELDRFLEVAKEAVAAVVGPQVTLKNSQTFPDFVAPMGEVQLEAGRPSKSQNGYSVLVSVFVAGKKINSRVINLQVDAASASTAIKAGDTVRIYLRSAGASIEVTGRARTSGFAGQQITVVSSTGSVHQGTVISGSEVEVKL